MEQDIEETDTNSYDLYRAKAPPEFYGGKIFKCEILVLAQGIFKIKTENTEGAKETRSQLTTIGVKLDAIARANPETNPMLVGSLINGKSFICETDELADVFIKEGRAFATNATLRNNLNPLIAHWRNLMKESKGISYPGIYSYNNDKSLKWLDETNSIYLPPIPQCKEEARLISERLAIGATDEELKKYFTTFTNLLEHLPPIWRSSVVFAISFCMGAHFAAALRRSNINYGIGNLYGGNHSLKTPIAEICTALFSNGEINNNSSMRTNFRREVKMSLPIPIIIDEAINPDDSFFEVMKSGVSTNNTSIRGRADGKGTKVPTVATILNTSNTKLSDDVDIGGGVAARMLCFKTHLVVGKADPNYGTDMAVLKGHLSGKIGRWILDQCLETINRQGYDNFLADIRASAIKYDALMGGYSKRAETLSTMLLLQNIIQTHVKEKFGVELWTETDINLMIDILATADKDEDYVESFISFINDIYRREQMKHNKNEAYNGWCDYGIYAYPNGNRFISQLTVEQWHKQKGLRARKRELTSEAEKLRNAGLPLSKVGTHKIEGKNKHGCLIYPQNMTLRGETL